VVQTNSDACRTSKVRSEKTREVRPSLAALMATNVNIVRAVMSFIMSTDQYAVMEAIVAKVTVHHFN
jgi:hypothetical protein